MVGVTSVVYCKSHDVLGIERLFPFNSDIIICDDNELKKILKELIEEMSISTERRTNG